MVKVIRSYLTWGLFLGIAIVEGHDAHRFWSILGIAALYAVGSGVLATLLNAADRRWPQPLRWPRKWRGRRNGSVFRHRGLAAGQGSGARR